MPDYKPLTPKEIERGYYFLNHRQQFIRLAYGLGIFVCLIIYSIFVYNLVIFFRYSSWQKLAANFVTASSWSAAHSQSQPKNLNIGLPRALLVGDGIYNLVAIVKNPNTDWLLPEFEYNFVVNGEDLPAKVSYLNSEDSVVLSSLGYRSNQAVKDVKLKINNYKWRRLSSDIKQIKWSINNINFKPLSREKVGDKTVVFPARASWQAKNLSLYDFWQVDWQVLLLNGENLVGFTEIPARDFNSLELRDMEAIFAYNLASVSRVEIIPRVNWFDRDNFKLIESSGNTFGL